MLTWPFPYNFGALYLEKEAELGFLLACIGFGASFWVGKRLLRRDPTPGWGNPILAWPISVSLQNTIASLIGFIFGRNFSKAEVSPQRAEKAGELTKMKV